MRKRPGVLVVAFKEHEGLSPGTVAFQPGWYLRMFCLRVRVLEAAGGAEVKP